MRLLFVLNFVFMSCFFIVYYIHKKEQMPWYFYLIIIIGALLYSWWITFLFKRRMQSTRKRLLEEDDAEFDEKIVCRDGINHIEKIVATGGIGYLLQSKLVFIPHKLNITKKELTILFSDILNISDYRVWGLFETGVKITLNTGKIEKFVVDKAGDFYCRLMNLKTDR